jgi:hypothetical protein
LPAGAASAVECDGWFVIAATNGSVSLPGAVDGGSLSGFGSGIFKLLERSSSFWNATLTRRQCWWPRDDRDRGRGV